MISISISAPQARVLSLRNTAQKMSKSDPNSRSRILLTDPPDQISAKLRTAVTDSIQEIYYAPDERPGVSNLLDILVGVQGGDQREVAKEFRDASHLKETVAQAVQEKLAGIRAEFERIRAEDGYIESVERQGREKAREVASETMAQVRTAVGF
jgi:tryptophanyl-tRNA synthetase